jgi:hypothetical protein
MKRVLMVLLKTLAFTPAVRAGAESFHIDAGGEPYHTKTEFSRGTRHHVTASGHLFAEQGDSVTLIDA